MAPPPAISTGRSAAPHSILRSPSESSSINSSSPTSYSRSPTAHSGSVTSSPTFFSRIRSSRSRSPRPRSPRRTSSAVVPPTSAPTASTFGGVPHSPSVPVPGTGAAASLRDDAVRPHRLHLRTDSSSSANGGGSGLGSGNAGGLTTPPGGRARSRSQKRNSGPVMQVGRHSNDWLFGGFSFTSVVKGVLSPGQESDNGRD